MLQTNSYTNSKDFYSSRIRFITEQHCFSQREQMLGMVLQAAMSDKGLSVSDLLFVLNEVETAHQRSMEANFNETWKP